MKKYMYAVLAVLAVGLGSAPGGEEFMPLFGDDGYRTLTSNDPAPERRERPQLHRNMVTLQLPSLGGKAEGRPLIVDAQKSGLDGSLNFDTVRPAAPVQPANEFADIPGLVVPEVLAMEKYNLSPPEPVRTARSAYPPTTPSVTPEEFAAGWDLSLSDPGFAAAPPAGLRAGPGRREYPEDRVPEGIAFARIEIPAPAARREGVTPEPVTLPPPLPEPASRTALAASPGAAPAALDPTEPERRSLRPPAATAESAAAPQAWRESIPASGAVMSTRPVGRSRRVAPLSRAEASPVSDLKSTLNPIYRQGND